MKTKTLLTISLTVLSVAVCAQRMAEASKTHEKIHITENNDRVQMDTLWGNYSNWPAADLYFSSTGMGYVLGNNNYGDLQKAQVYINVTGTPMRIKEVILWFGVKKITSGNASSKVMAKTYNINGTGTNASGTNTPAPGASTSSADLLAADIDTVEWNIVAFSNPVVVTDDFAVGVDFTMLAPGDTAALMSSIDGGGNVYEDLAWEQWNDSAWHSLASPTGWELDIQMAVFPIVDTDVTGMKNIINEDFKLYQNIPNPFSNTSYVFYELTEAAHVSLEVFDITGKSMAVIYEGFKSAGKSMVMIDAHDFPPGIYPYSITIGDRRVIRKMVIFN